MKKAFSILTVFLVLAAMLQITVARHYCGGDLAASKVSLSGKLATCGMEGTEESCPLKLPGRHLKSHCCDDVVTIYFTDNIYTHEFSVLPETNRTNNHVLDLPVSLIAYFLDIKPPFYTDLSPPPFPISTSVDLAEICVFRI